MLVIRRIIDDDYTVARKWEDTTKTVLEAMYGPHVTDDDTLHLAVEPLHDSQIHDITEIGYKMPDDAVVVLATWFHTKWYSQYRVLTREDWTGTRCTEFGFRFVDELDAIKFKLSWY
jgi:hypothetical protein